MDEMSTDPVCGMRVAREKTPHYQLNGSTYFFCSTTCRREFVADPEAFTNRTTRRRARRTPKRRLMTKHG